MNQIMSTSQRDIVELERQVEAASRPFRHLVDQIQRVIVGQDSLIEGLLCSHCFCKAWDAFNENVTVHEQAAEQTFDQ